MRILVALGGNAIKQAHERGTFEEQAKNIRRACEQLLKLIRAGHELVITHGNGPQVGALLIQQESTKEVPSMPLHVCGAMTQGQIGYMIQQTLENLLELEGIEKKVVTVVTRVLVNKNDPDFKDPSKPIGPFYTEEQARRLMREKGWIMKKVRPKEPGWRRVVPSPDPLKIIEGPAIKSLVDSGFIVIASGGGGIPVIKEGGELKGVDAVIDKDLAGEKLAEVVGADAFLVLTDVEFVKLNFGKPNEKDIREMDVEEAKRYLQEGHFLKGSMEPKVKACIRFVEAGGQKAIIAHLFKAYEAIQGLSGTLIRPSHLSLQP